MRSELAFLALCALCAGGCGQDERAVPSIPICDRMASVCDQAPATGPAFSNPEIVVPSAKMPVEVVSQLSHNNLDIVWFGGRLYFAFRTGPHHFASTDTVMYVVSTEDLASWRFETKVVLGRDVREPRFLAVGGRLFLYFAVLGDNPLAFQPEGSRVIERLADQDWSTPEKIFEPGFIGWRARTVGEKHYMIGYTGGENIYQGTTPTVNLYWLETADGRHFTPVVPGKPIVQMGGGSETDFAILDDGSVVFVMRNELGDADRWGSKICRAEAGDLGNWTCKSDPKKYDSPLDFPTRSKRLLDRPASARSRRQFRSVRNRSQLRRPVHGLLGGVLEDSQTLLALEGRSRQAQCELRSRLAVARRHLLCQRGPASRQELAGVQLHLPARWRRFKLARRSAKSDAHLLSHAHAPMTRRLVFGLCALGLWACGHDERAPAAGDPTWVPPPEACESPDPSSPESFGECSTGSGIFGRWTRDLQGLPAYDYRLDQHADSRASYPVSEADEEGVPLDRRDHWAAFGNSRINAMVFNDGYIEVATQDRGVEYLNKADASQSAWAGGFGWLSDGEEAWCTGYEWRPSAATTTRRFGMGYAESSLTYRDVRMERVTTAPVGDMPVVVSDVTLENLDSSSTKKLSHWEYWDIARRPIEINWVVSGEPFTLAPGAARETRDSRNALFDESVSYDATENRLSLRREYVGSDPRPPALDPSAIDYYPNEPFLLSPFGGVSDVFVEKRAFFGGSGVALPQAVASNATGSGVADGPKGSENGAGQPHLFVMRSDLVLAPGEKRTLRFVYGYARSGEAYPTDVRFQAPSWDPRAEYTTWLRKHLLYFASEDAPELQRELAWHAYQIEASVGYRDYWQGHVVPQGSAYLYLHGADGAARDLGLFALPLVYTDPELAREELRLFMGIQFADERFSYAFQGHGMLDNAHIHTAPSDLPLFFVWALSEYVGATGDEGFLDEHVPYWPRDARPDATTWSHLVGALRHLFDVVATGEHGLVRIGTGDWSDGIVVEAPNRDLAVEKGESVPNTQMAVAVLPRVADLVETRDPALAQEIRTRVEGFRQALAGTWTGDHFVRAYFGDGVPVYADSVNLESQIWALIGDSFANPADRTTLVNLIEEKLDDPSPIGATLLPGAQVWPAISAPLTWGYAISDPERAWAHLTRNTMAAHAVAFPDVWYGIWSGPDGVSSKSGLAWKSQVTPMTDFPVQNNNYHAMPLLAALRMAGIEATATGIRVSPRIPRSRYSLRTRLVELERDGNVIRGAYRPTSQRVRSVVLDAPPGKKLGSVHQNGKLVPTPSGATQVTLTFEPAASSNLAFEVELSP